MESEDFRSMFREWRCGSPADASLVNFEQVSHFFQLELDFNCELWNDKERTTNSTSFAQFMDKKIGK